MNPTAFIGWLARTLAVSGGCILIVVTLLTVASISGRAVLSIANNDATGVLGWFSAAAMWLTSLGFELDNGWRIRIGNVPGDFELVEAGVGFAVFAFLPWCQLNRGHATVDIFTNFLSAGANRAIDLIAEFLMTVVIVLFAWRLWYGMLDKMRYNETTFILQFPLWWPYAVCMVAAVIGVVVSFYVLWVRIREFASGQSILGQGQGGLH